MDTNRVSIQQIRSDLSGRVIGPDDPGYDEARSLFYGGFDRRPSAIVRVADETDVSRVVALARDTGIELAVRSGGHSLAGHSVSDGGIVLDHTGAVLKELDLTIAHGDFLKCNILIGADSRVVVVDTEARYRAPIYLDLGYFVGGLVGSFPWQLALLHPFRSRGLTAHWEEVLAGYAGISPDSREEDRVVPEEAGIGGDVQTAALQRASRA
jgi:hypothetical protein